MNFEIEIVEAYSLEPVKNKRNSQNYSVHAYIAMFDIDIRGITIQKKSNGWYVLMPSKSNFDLEQKKRIYFPIIEFTNPKTKKEFIFQIKEKFIEYMMSNPEIENKIVKVNKGKPGFLSEKSKEKLEFLSKERSKNPKYKGKNNE